MRWQGGGQEGPREDIIQHGIGLLGHLQGLAAQGWRLGLGLRLRLGVTDACQTRKRRPPSKKARQAQEVVRTLKNWAGEALDTVP